MKTPIYDFIKKYAESDSLRFHMPGHKGKATLGVEPLDITEIPGADVLYSSGGIIRESEAATAEIFGSERTLFSAEGSSLCIRAMLCLIKKYAAENGKRAKLIAARNVHKTFLTATALLDIDVSFLSPKGGSILSCELDFDELSKKIEKETPTAVYITSPDYLGNVADIEKISKLCRERGVLLVVDNAHGAYLKFLSPSRHPIDLGADMCCDSAHKTLPVLTGGAYLHISKLAPKLFSEEADEAMALFASTSPSYLILASLDLANKRLAEGFCDEINRVSEKKQEICKKLSEKGFDIIGDEPLKLTIAPKSFGYTGDELAALLLKEEIVCEFADSDFVVMMFSADTGAREFSRLEEVLLAVSKKEAIKTLPPRAGAPERALSPKDALFSSREVVCAEKSEGRIFADVSISCPPAVPILICGERISREAVEMLRYYGIKTCKVVKKDVFKQEV